MNDKDLTESAIQQEIITWFNNRFPALRGLLFSVPNGGLRTKREANKLKHEGLTAGIPDLIFAYRNRAYFLEIKTETGVLSDVQREITEKLIVQGFSVCVCRSCKEVEIIIMRILADHNDINLTRNKAT